MAIKRPFPIMPKYMKAVVIGKTNKTILKQ